MSRYLNLPWVESPFFSQILEQKKLPAQQEVMVQFYHDNGFLKLSDWIPPHISEGIKKDMETNKRGEEQSIPDLWQHSEPVRALAGYQTILDMLQLFYEREAFPFQTINVCESMEQRAHSNATHFSSLPARYMCSVWVALEDITEENGALFCYPASHRLPEYTVSHIKKNQGLPSKEDHFQYESFMEDLIRVNKFQKEILFAKKGDAFLLSNTIIYGRMPVKKGMSGCSQLTHYFFKDCYYYTPMLSDGIANELSLRTHVKNINTNKVIIPSYNGQSFNLIKTGDNKYMFDPNISFMGMLKVYAKKYAKKMRGN